MLPILRQLFGMAMVAVSAVACCSTAPPAAAPDAQPKDAVSAVRDATVMLLESIPEIGEIGQCAGVFIESHKILTARHCVCETDEPGDCVAAVAKHKPIAFITYADWAASNRPHKSLAHVDAVSPSADLAVLVSVASAPAVARTTLALPQEGERVFALGHPRSEFFTVMQGRALSLLVDERVPLIAVQMPLWGGASGGPLCLADGRVVGIASVKLTSDGAFGGYTPVAFMP